ncbi:MAG: FtsX-like permease family protein, partial [Ilumatobacteraceae bacterium]
MPGGPHAQVVPFRLQGEMPTQGSATVVVTRTSAERVGLAIGDSVLLAGWCTPDGDPMEFLNAIELKISGLSIGPLDVEPAGVGLTLHPMFVDPVAFEVMIAGGAEQEQTVTAWLKPEASTDTIADSFESYSIVVDFRERRGVFDDALRTDADLLWLLAAVGALAGLLVLAPVIGRNMRDTGPNTETLAALGTRRPQIVQQALAHTCALAVIGAVSAAIVAAPVSALMPAGLSESLYPDREVQLDSVSIVIGVVLIIAVVVVIGAIPAWRMGRAEQSATVHASEPSGAFALLGLRPAFRTGLSAAIGAPVGPRRASPWPSLISMVVAAIVGVASLTYLAGLRHLERTPRVLGWNWDAIVGFDFIATDPESSAATMKAVGELDVVEVMTEGTFYPPWILSVPGTDVLAWPWSFDTGPNAIRPVVLSGRAPEGPDEVAVDALFAAQTGLGVGDTVSLTRPSLIDYMADQFPQAIQELELDYELPEVPEQASLSKEFEITGIALTASDSAQELPEITLTLDGLANLVEPTADEVALARAWLPNDLPSELVAEAADFLANLDIGGRVAYLRFSGSVQDGADAVAEALVAVGSTPDIIAPSPENALSLISGLNVESNDRVPVALVIMVAIAFLAIAAYLLGVSIRSRRFEMAVMRSLGLSTGGLRWSVAAQATVTALVAMVVAIPVGVLVGRWAWLRYARDLG